MQDKNGVELKTGQVVEVTGAYFKHDNGLYFVTHSPGDPSWSGKSYSLKKIAKTGKISKAKYSLAFWPLSSVVNDRFKTMEASAWNAEHSQIEVTKIKSMAEVAAYFEAEAAEVDERIAWDIRHFGEDSQDAKRGREHKDFLLALAKAIKEEEVKQ